MTKLVANTINIVVKCKNIKIKPVQNEGKRKRRKENPNEYRGEGMETEQGMVGPLLSLIKFAFLGTLLLLLYFLSSERREFFLAIFT